MKKEYNVLGAIVLSLALNNMAKNFKLINVEIFDKSFFVDFNSEESISINDFKKIEKEMKKIISGAYEIKKHGNNIICGKLEFPLLDFNDINNTKYLKEFLISSIGGLENNIHNHEKIKDDNYKFESDEINHQAFRIHGSGFENINEKDEYLKEQEELKSRDHRKLGSELKIFTFDDLAGQGLPIFLPNGAHIKDRISSYLKSIFKKYGFQLVSTPILGSKKLYETSGHWDLYKENNFPPIKVDHEEFMLRPMTCPHHMLVYKSAIRSYKELPIAYYEDSKLHRYESSGGLIGLERVRAMELMDVHVFLQRNQIKQMIKTLDEIVRRVYKKLNIKIDRVDLSLRSKDKEKFYDDDNMWNESQSMLREILKELKYDFYEMEGEAAFYGPKIDFQYKTILGKYITISTIQLDFLLPKRFELEYKNSSNEMEVPVIIHFGVIGTYERFISVLLTQTKGNLPFWLQKIQVDIIPVNNELHYEYAKKIKDEISKKGFSAIIDNSNERLSKKIMNSQKNKTRFQIVVGDDELRNNNINVRRYGEERITSYKINDFIGVLEKEK